MKSFLNSPFFKIFTLAGIIMGFTFAIPDEFIKNILTFDKLEEEATLKVIGNVKLCFGILIFLITIIVVLISVHFDEKIVKNNQLKNEKEQYLLEIKNSDIPKLKSEIERLKTGLNKEKGRSKKPNHIHKRFENIFGKKLKYVAIDYKPFFWMKDDAKKETPKGIGYELMRKIFEPFNVQLINVNSCRRL